ncbi:MAG: hypothetical protein LBB46_00655 [Coriobacteriaceae bacterium]|jgi:uncharacterized membrane protein HdeD (DUF308 family)|nr:hypothetical protein [Coriobacteriaceae bacterium]
MPQGETPQEAPGAAAGPAAAASRRQVAAAGGLAAEDPRQVAAGPAAAEKAGRGFVVKWTLLVCAGLACALAGRILGYADGPFYLTYLFAVAVAISSVSLIVVGGFVFERGLRRRAAWQKRRGAMIIVLGLCMLAGHFIFRTAVPLIFG